MWKGWCKKGDQLNVGRGQMRRKRRQRTEKPRKATVSLWLPMESPRAYDPGWWKPHVTAILHELVGELDHSDHPAPFLYTMSQLGHHTDMALGRVCSGRFEFRLVAGDETATFLLYTHKVSLTL